MMIVTKATSSAVTHINFVLFHPMVTEPSPVTGSKDLSRATTRRRFNRLYA